MEYIFEHREALADLIISRAAQLPKNVVIDADSFEGYESMMFALSLTDEQLVSFKKETEKKKGEIQISFAAQSSPNSKARQIDITTYPWREAKKIVFDADTPIYHDIKAQKYFEYIDVIFIEY